ncbi:MAG: hypothetical protein WD227_16930, partial [Vicinamibacterales bacterium]
CATLTPLKVARERASLLPDPRTALVPIRGGSCGGSNGGSGRAATGVGAPSGRRRDAASALLARRSLASDMHRRGEGG